MPSMLSRIAKLEALHRGSRCAEPSVSVALRPTRSSLRLRALRCAPGPLLLGHRQLQRFGVYREPVAVQVNSTRALRASVLRRAVSSSAFVFGVKVMRFSSHCQRSCALAGGSGPVAKQRPNPSIERTSNIRLRLLSAAAHVKRSA
jgi:hypothetical protein